MKPIILFRPDRENFEEEISIKKYFDYSKIRSKIPPNSLVIPRYSCLPYYKELEEDVNTLGSKLINTHKQFKYIEQFEYYNDIKNYTFQTWFNQYELPDNTQFVVKGVTNSRKHLWNQCMFAQNKQAAIMNALSLREDSMIGQQDIIFRKYEKLVTYEIGINGLAFTNEWRFFFYKDIELCHGYYWSNADEPNKGNLTKEGINLAHKVANIIKNHNNFFVIDIAEKQSGEWIVVELNAGEMSGLSFNDPNNLYSNLSLIINN